MQTRRLRARNAFGSSPKLVLLEVKSASTGPISLRVDHPLVVAGHDWEATFAAREDAIVEVRLSGGAAVRVNDVQVRAVARVRAGDLITLPDRSLLVQRLSAAPAAPAMPASHEAFEQRLIEEVDRSTATHAHVSVLVVWSRALVGDGLAEFLAAPEFHGLRKRAGTFVTGQTAPGTLEFLFAGATGVDADDIREQLSEVLARLGRPFRWGWATAPAEGQHPATLWGRALDRLFGERPELADDLPHVDPVMVRLWALCDLWAGMKRGLLLQGDAGSGRETLARVIHERRAPHAPLIVVRSAKFDGALWRTSLERAHGGTLYVRHLDALPAFERSGFWDATAFQPMAGVADHLFPTPPIVISVPPLRDRPDDVMPIAEYVLARCTGLDASRKPKLTLSAKSLLASEWTGSVRELKNSLQRAALLADTSGEILAEHIASDVTRLGGGPFRQMDLRASLRNTERRTFLETLGRTSWNVSEAARRLGLPRRTLIYRMSKLGLRRPARNRVS